MNPWLTEGDAWFRRNQKALETAAERDWALRLIGRNGLKPVKVLEVGCANGWRLAEIRKQGYSRVHWGVDISEEAVIDGQTRYNLDLLVSSADYLRMDAVQSVYSALAGGGNVSFDDYFDLTIMYFVAHWIERRLLFRSLAELDRVTKDNGYLLIGDFLPDTSTKVSYHHREGLWTWKADYAGIFLATGTYRLIDRVIFDHDSGEEGNMSIPVYRRAAASLLRKEDCYE